MDGSITKRRTETIFQWTRLGKVLLLLLVSLATAGGYTMEERCRYWAGPGFIGDPSDCQAFGYCRNNQLVHRDHCKDEMQYDYHDGTCTPEDGISCHTSLADVCARMRPGQYAAAPTDCGMYVMCGQKDSDHARGRLMGGRLCPEHQLFSNKLQSCVEDTKGCPQDYPCDQMQDNSLLADPKSCRSYLLCTNGLSTKIKCSSRRYFNRKTGHCQTSLPDECEGRDEIESPADPPYRNPDVCRRFYDVDSESLVQLVPDTMTCHGYYWCRSKSDSGEWDSCPRGTHFQWWSQRCLAPETTNCPYDRCANLDNRYVAILDTGCREYTVCQNQQSESSGKCPPSDPYFDETLGYCGKHFPNYRICYMAG